MNSPFNLESSAASEATERVYKTWRERFVTPLLAGVLVFGAIAIFPAIKASTSLLINGIFISTYLLVALAAIIRFPYNVRITIFLFSAYILGFGELLRLGILGDSLFFFLGLVIFATMLHSPRAGIASILATLATYAIVGWLMINGRFESLNPNAAPAGIEDWISAGIAFILVGVVIIIGFQQLEREFSGVQNQISSTLEALRQERSNLETRVQERTQQLRRINEVERAVAAIIDVNEIMPLAVKFIQTEFNFYYTAIYLLDPSGRWAELKDAAGETGKIMKAKKHRINTGGKNIVAQAIRSKTGQIMQDPNQIRLENPLFPYTRSLIAMPLVVGDTILGALEMHSSKDNEFLPQDLETYQNMANGVAISIENSRLFQEAQQSINEMRATQRQYLESAWVSLVSEKPLQYALGDADASGNFPLEVPLALRNQIIGQILAAGQSEWTNDQKSLVEAIATQATLALENARLVEDSQLTAILERLTNEIIAKIWASPNLDTILQTTVRELGRNLEAAEVEIEVSMEGADGE